MFKTIVAGTDGSATADRSVAVAAELARQSGGCLHLVSARRTGPSVGPAGGIVGNPAAAVAAAGLDRLVAAEGVLDTTTEQVGSELTVQRHAPEGDPGKCLVRVADDVGADLIVVGSKGMRGARRVLGSVPNTVSHGASCAVLIVKTC